MKCDVNYIPLNQENRLSNKLWLKLSYYCRERGISLLKIVDFVFLELMWDNINKC